MPTTIQSSCSLPHLLNAGNSRQRLFRSSAPIVPTKPMARNRPLYNSIPCYDWVFSSASNAHIAIDRSAFKTYTPFKSYVLTVADHRQILVKGIGSIDLDLRRKRGSRKCHTITLDNVLHAPGWMCNIFSDVYFEGNGEFEHSWGKDGVQFMKKRDECELRTWGFTEEFCGLDKLVLARNVRGRSPMLEDPDREVFSINVKWPQGQMDRWEAFVKEMGRRHDDQKGMLLERDGNVGRQGDSSLALKA